MEKFQNKYRIGSARLKNWDYGRSAAYFITICTANREHYFGEIEQGQMHLTQIGQVTEEEWVKSIAIRPDMNLSLGDFVVMPNHFHAIIFIGENVYNQSGNDGGGDGITGDGHDIAVGGGHDIGRNAMHRVSTNMHRIIGGIPNNQLYTNQFGPQSKNLASVVRGFKSAVTTYARKNNIPFDWQKRYHDHIIRNDAEYNRIADYIQNNVAQWEKDKFYGGKDCNS